MCVNTGIKTLYILLLSGVMTMGFAQDPKADSLLSLLAVSPVDTHRVKLLLELGEAQKKQDYRAALDYYLQSLALARRLAYDPGLSETYARMASFHFIYSDFDSVLVCIDSSLYYLHKTGMSRRLSETYLTRANICLSLGNYQDALSDCLSAEKHARETGDKDALAQIFQLQANIYRSQNQLTPAMEFQNKSILLFRELDDRVQEGHALYTSAMLHLRMRNTSEAHRTIRTAISIADSIKNYDNMATYRQVLTEIFLEEKKYPLAEATAAKALQYAEISETDAVKGYVLEVFALLHQKQENYPQAIRYGLAGYAVFEDGKEPWHQRKLASILAETYEKLGNTEKALYYQKIFNDLNDLLLRQEQATETRHLQLQFRYREKDNEIKLLAKEKELQEQRLSRQTAVSLLTGTLALLFLGGIVLLRNRSRLKAQIQELQLRNHIASDLHDEVGSSLSSIHLLSQMIRNQPENSADLLETMSHNVKETVDRITDMVWVVKPEENEQGSLRERMERFAYDICNCAGIELELDIADTKKNTLTMDQRKNIYLIFKEAVNNAVKYSGTEKLTVELTQKGKNLILNVKDYGRGFDPATVKSGNGLGNIQKRAKELNAELDISTRTGEGTAVKLVMAV